VEIDILEPETFKLTAQFLEKTQEVVVVSFNLNDSSFPVQNEWRVFGECVYTHSSKAVPMVVDSVFRKVKQLETSVIQIPSYELNVKGLLYHPLRILETNTLIILMVVSKSGNKLIEKFVKKVQKKIADFPLVFPHLRLLALHQRFFLFKAQSQILIYWKAKVADLRSYCACILLGVSTVYRSDSHQSSFHSFSFTLFHLIYN
jgi:hypothetical protein